MEEVVERASAGRGGSRARSARAAGALPLPNVDVTKAPRIGTGISELDRVLGGGLMPGSIVLVGGDPGLGKSTLMLQLCASARVDHALYVTGEESLQQIKQRADRLGVQGERVSVCSETNIEAISGLINTDRPGIVIIDSVQTMSTDMMDSSPGSVGQVRECTALLTRIAKDTGIPIILIGHVTKDGMIAGPKVLEHMVDTVLQFEGDGMYSYRVLRALKNRYGSTNELGVFDMTGTGMREVTNPSEALLSHARKGEAGTAIVAVIEGTRPLLVEVQALVSHSGYSVPQRVSTGYDAKRLQMILAVLEKRGGVQVRQSDVFVNVAGGIAIQDPAIDLGVAVAIAGSVTDVTVPTGMCFIGEVGLTGEVRRAAFAEQRVAEAVRLGLTRIVMPPYGVDGLSAQLRSAVEPAERISNALRVVFG